MSDLFLDAMWKERAVFKAPLAEYTTFRIGGPAKWLIEISDSDELATLVRHLSATGTPWRLLGGGSNILASDEGLNAVVIVFRQPSRMVEIAGSQVIACGGVDFSDLAILSANAGMAGLEFCAGIPGTLGGAIAGNAGAFGEQIGDVLEWAELLGHDGSLRRVEACDLGFAYRNSRLKASGEIVVKAAIALKPGDRKASLKRIDEIMALRQSKHPDWKNTPCAGSFFRNIEPTSAASRRQAAGAFLDQAGAKQMREGGAAVYEKHANIIINSGDASCADVVALATRMRQAVMEKFGIALIREVQIWPSGAAPDLPVD